MMVLVNSLEDFFSALPLGGEAGDGPHLDLHSGVKLLPPHVPHPVAGCGHCAVLERQCRVDLLGLTVAQTHAINGYTDNARLQRILAANIKGLLIIM